MKWMHAAVVGLAVSATFSSYSLAQISGKVMLDGDPPEAAVVDMSGVAECAAIHADPVYDPTVTVGEKGELANVIVSIDKESHPDLAGETPGEKAVLDQKGCMYEPHVLALMVGQELVIKNSDSFLHNVHSLSETNPQFNFGQPNKDPGKAAPEQPKVAEYFRVKCDVHPWMSAYIGVFDHPYFAVTKDDGTFEIKKAPDDGEYTLVAWHEKYGKSEPQTVTIKDGKASGVEFKFDAASARGNEAPIGEIKLAAAKTAHCPAGGCEGMAKSE